MTAQVPSLASHPSRWRGINQLLVALLTFAAICLMVYSAYAFSPVNVPYQMLSAALIALVAGCVCLTLALFLAHHSGLVQPPAFTFAAAAARFPAPPAHKRLLLLGILFLLLEAEITGQLLELPLLHRVSYWIQGGLFWGGVVGVGIGLAGIPSRAALTDFYRRLRAAAPEVLAFLAVIALALTLRLWDLKHLLPLSIDDGAHIPQIFPLLAESPAFGLVEPSGSFQTTQVYAQFLAMSARLLGYDLFGVRALNALLGTVHVAAVYLLARTLFDKRMALLSAMILATFPPHVHFSRTSFLHLADALFGTLAIAFLCRAMQHNRRADWVLAGISLGLTQYFFDAGRLYFPPLIALWLLLIALFNFQALRRLWRGTALFLVTAVLVAMPTYYAALVQHNPISLRMDDSGLGSTYWSDLLQSGDLDAIANRLAVPFLAFVHVPEVSKYYAGKHPMVLEYVVPLFLLGAVYFLWRWRTPALIVSLWLLTTAGANLLMHGSGEYPRFIVGHAAIALTIAGGLYYVVPLLIVPLGIRHAVILQIALLVSLGQAVYYFNEHVPALKYQIRATDPVPDAIDAAIRAASFATTTEIFLISEVMPNSYVPSTMLVLFRWEQPSPRVKLTAIAADGFTADYISALPRDRDYAFFIEPGHADLVARLAAVFVLEDPQYTSQQDIPAGKAFILYYAPRDRQTLAAPIP